MKNYSQFEEQTAILKAFGNPEIPRRFLDIGSWDAVTFSNTRALVELGWSGVLIEPAPGPMIELLRSCTTPGCEVGVDERVHEPYGDRKSVPCSRCGGIRYGFSDKVTIIQAAVGLEPGLMRLCATDDALSTNNEKNLKVWEKEGGFYGWINVPVITLEQIFNQFGGFDFVNIDVEGTSVDLFLKMLSLGILPRCVAVEHDDRLSEACAAATSMNYSLTYSNGTNGVFVR